MSSFDDARIRQLSQAADEAMAQGRLDAAAQLWEQVLALAPAHGKALFRLGQHALYRKDAAGAVELLRRAVSAAPAEPMIRLSLSFAYRALGDTANETAEIEAALKADPYCYPALLLRGALLERRGMKRQAARTYKDALAIAPEEPQLPAEFRSQILHARKCVSANAESLEHHLNSVLGNLRERHRAERLARFEQCKDGIIGTKRIYGCQPTMLHFPGVPAIQFYENEDFPWLAAVEAQAGAIREDLIALIEQQRLGFRPYVAHPPGVPLNQWAELNHSPRWSAFFLWEDGVRNDMHCNLCPATVLAISAAPLCDIAGFAPAVFFSTLEPRTRIPPHTGVTNARLIVHLPLVVPAGCGFRVGNDSREWRPGEAWVFDDTIEHEAWNDSDSLRVLLIFDIWNPNLSLAERELVAALLNGVRSYYGEEDNSAVSGA